MQKYVKKTEPYRYQWKDNQDRTLEVRDSKPPTGEIKTISRELKTLKSLKKAQGREINSVHSWVPPMKIPKNDEPDIVFPERDSHGNKQPHDNLLVIMLRIEEFNIHRVLIDNGSLTDIVCLLAF